MSRNYCSAAVIYHHRNIKTILRFSATAFHKKMSEMQNLDLNFKVLTAVILKKHFDRDDDQDQ